MITSEQSEKLKDYFPVKSHEFLNGNTYISEEAITNRLDDVDPSWSLERLDVYRNESVVTAIFRLTVCGVSRDGVGMAVVQLSKEKDREVNEAEKSAATDALKRAARLFGIGRYILEMGKAVTDYRSLEQWLYQRQNKVTSLASENAPQTHQEAVSSDLAQAAGDYQPRPPQQALNGNGAPPAGQKKESSGAWSVLRNDLLAARKERAPDVSYQEWNNVVNKLHEENALEGVPFADAIAKVIARVESHKSEVKS